MRTLKYFFLVVDIAFVIYWSITALHLIPAEYLYNNYTNPILVNWNWSFFPLDMIVSASGFYSLLLYRKSNQKWMLFALISLILTFASGLQAISYWFFAKEFDITWWSANLFLLIYPLFFIPQLIRKISE